MMDEQKTDYAYKDDLMRSYISLIIHEACALESTVSSAEKANIVKRIVFIS